MPRFELIAEPFTLREITPAANTFTLLPTTASGPFQGWVWPMPVWNGRNPVITNGFDPTPSAKWGMKHAGVDIMYLRHPHESARLPEGHKRFFVPSERIPVYAVGNGVVIQSGKNPLGHHVIIDHGNGYHTFYQHLTANGLPPKSARITAGMPIGFVGHNPFPGGYPLNHLHFEIWPGGVKARAIDPGQVLRGRPTPAPATLDQLRVLANPSTPATVSNALTIMKIICAYRGIPWRVGFTILEHEGGVRLIKHNDGVMQTISSARKDNIPLIPRPLKLAVLGLPSNDATSDPQLNSRIHDEFAKRLAVQIAVGTQELKGNLDRFNGYIALAYQAYNAGAGWAYYTVTRGQKARPKAVSEIEWEKMCLEGATLLHRSPSQIKANTGVWQCDANMPGWFKHISVYDSKTGVALVAYKYLRSFVGQIRKNPPNIPCNLASHRSRQQGTGPVVSEKSRNGTLDKLYDPRKLSGEYFRAVQQEIGPLGDDGWPLKVENGQLVKKPTANI
jgi:hypothetical protein